MYDAVFAMVRNGFPRDLSSQNRAITENQLEIVKFLHENRDLNLNCCITGYSKNVKFTPFNKALTREGNSLLL